MNKFSEWTYNIGDRIIKDNLDITIIGRRSHNSHREYQYICNKCGYDSSKPHYVRGEYRKELWFPTNKINTKCTCGCCGSMSPRIVQPGINDINTTDPWMTKYFVNKEDTLRLTHSSGKRVLMKCPDCDAKEKNYIVQKLYEAGHLPCACSDTISMPNKIAYYTIKSVINYFNYYEREYCPGWAGRYKYDNYLKINGKEYIIEMDGELGHGNLTFNHDEDTEGLKRDKIKEELAKIQNIKIIRIDCVRKSRDKIFDELCNILNSIIGQEIEYNRIDILRNTAKNIVKEVCLYYDKHNNEKKIDIAKRFNIGMNGLRAYLRIGNELGWCNYDPTIDTKAIKKDLVIELKNSNIELSYLDIAKITGISSGYVYKLLQEGADEGICTFHSEEDRQVMKKKNGRISSDRNSKTVYVYDEKMNYIGEYKNSIILQNHSINDFGVFLNFSNIRHACTSDNHKYKGLYFYEHKLA